MYHRALKLRAAEGLVTRTACSCGDVQFREWYFDSPTSLSLKPLQSNNEDGIKSQRQTPSFIQLGDPKVQTAVNCNGYKRKWAGMPEEIWSLTFGTV